MTPLLRILAPYKELIFVVVTVAVVSMLFMRQCTQNEEAAKLAKAITTVETENAKALKDMNEVNAATRVEVLKLQDTYLTKLEELRSEQEMKLGAAQTELLAQIDAIEENYAADLEKRRKEILDELDSKIGDDPADVGRLFLDIFGPSPGTTYPTPHRP